MKDLVVIMGVAGSGKTTTGRAVAEAGGWPFIEADEHHSDANRAKMTAGTPLTDADRVDWVASMTAAANGMPAPRVVLACSALTDFVQTALQAQCTRAVHFIWLDVPKDQLAARMASREGHFMPVSLLESQLAALTVPAGAARMDGTVPTDCLVTAIRAALPPADPA
ncbi:MAG: gluconokinase, GntK/IdnK-type [Hyphomonas sp.]|uniref:gluconokinase n=1 Tax=Hyphomonas sp. TaxID=87 RepID=UPI0035277C24